MGRLSQRPLLVVIHSLTTLVSMFSYGLLAHDNAAQLNRSYFPSGFTFGVASSAYQYEGAAREGGKGLSIWDTYTHNHPEKIADRSNGDIADDSYHRYKEDVNIMKEMGMDAYRFSIAWSRILPNGSLSGGINQEGVKYYNSLIDELISHGLQPYVTLFHWDTPQALEDQYEGFLSPNIVKDFRDYSGVCFKEFGDRVKHWITFNEPHVFSSLSYGRGLSAPGRCSSSETEHCSAGDSAQEPYIVSHNQLLAHAAAVKLYRDSFQVSQKGKIGITLDAGWFIPYSNSKMNDDAVGRALDFTFGWFMDPLTHGDYPSNMRALVGSRLPKFSKKQAEMVKGSFDFVGLNYYTTNYVRSLPIRNRVNKSYSSDSYTIFTSERNGIPIGPRAASPWLYVYPQGIQDILLYTKSKYNSPIIYITENGIDEVNKGTLPLKEALKDDARISYYQQHLYHIQRAIRKGVDVRGYFAWSLLDNFEWNAGYTVRFGIYYVDYRNGLKRYPKSSAHWFRKFLKG
ncbi:beta-glucosidase 12-like [Asparagus officinalis]|uniref:beta-glucosidase 12-like n=1 Tax=Asparagus officinalis TaxID=4686 RepID=UPI00098E551D|nr:beta-glucosidase 12-like [Asparagus officinalis]